MPISIRLPIDVEARLADLAVRTGRSKTYYATEAIIEHLDDLEDLYLAERELLEVRAGRSATVPLDEKRESEYSDLFGCWSLDEKKEFDGRVGIFDKIDESDWKR